MSFKKIGFVLVVAMALCLAAAVPSQAQSPAEKHCVQCGGVVKNAFPVFGLTVNGMRLGGNQKLCQFTSTTDFGSRIYAAIDTLYTDLPTLAASAYLFKPKYTPDTNPNKSPGAVYCGELNGTDRFDGGFGGWVVEGQDSPIDMCVFPDLSMIDSWGLLYHTNGVIRGADLTSCLRFKPASHAGPALFAEAEESGKADLTLGGGAQFWAYVSPSNDTSKWVTKWKVELQQGNWKGVITSNNPQQQLQTPGLSGIFNVKVTASGPGFPEKTLTAISWSKPNVGCNYNCASMVGIVATPDGKDANYWTTWDALCPMK